MMINYRENLIFFLIWLITIIMVRAIVKKNRTKHNLPPSPRALPLIGHMHLLAPIPHQALHKLSQRYGPIMQIFIGSNPCVIASSAEIAKEILKNHETYFLSRPKMANADYLTYGSSDFTFAPYGPYWKFIKKLCMTQLLGGPTLDHFRPIRNEEINRFLKLMLSKSQAMEVVDVGAELIRLTNNIISRMALSRRCSEREDEADEVRKLVKEMTELAGKFNFSDSIWFCKNLDLQGFEKRLKDVRGRYDDMMERIIKEHQKVKKESEGSDRVKDLLDILLDIYEDKSSEIVLTRENLKAFVMNIFGAGTDTSATTVEWALAELINHPDVMEKAREEINLAVGNSRVVEESDISKLPYLQSIVKETLRLHPTGPLIVRQSTEDCTINGYDIPAGTRVFVNVWALGRDPNHWDNPLQFWPERFMCEEGNKNGNVKSQFDVRGQHFQFLPFGSGRRSCPGASLAMHVVQTTLASMIQYFDWKANGEEGYCHVDMEEARGLSLPRKHPLMCVPVARIHPFPLK